jgi:RND superfamily putative drug exporter
MKINKKVRVLIPLLIILVWLVISSIGGPIFGKINNVSNNNESAFLPKSSQSTTVSKLQLKFEKSNSIPAIILYIASTKLSSSDISYFKTIIVNISSIKGVINTTHDPIVGPVIASNLKAAEIIVPTINKNNNSELINALTNATNRPPSSLKVYITGPAGEISALTNAFSGINGILMYVAVIAVLIILLIVYRSLLLPFLVLLTAIFALSAAILIVYLLALHHLLALNGESQGILSILVIGASTDYSILIISRYKEALHHQKSTFLAILKALKVAWEPILAAATTVIIALLMLLFSELNSNRSLGPVTAIGIGTSLLAAMTFLPAILATFGRKAFWPSKIKILDSKIKYTDSKLWIKISNLIRAKYRSVWIVLVLGLTIVALIGLPGLKASGVSQSQTILNKSRAIQGINLIGQYFPAGSGSPMVIITSKDKANQIVSKIKSTHQFSSVTLYSLAPNLKPETINNMNLINATTKQNAESKEALNLVAKLRVSLAKIDPKLLIGGSSAIQLDTNNAATHDLKLIIPIVLAVILIILIILLRSILAPILLILTVILSFSATIGVSALFFNHVFHFPGADPSVPLFGFIFLVALGVDYNIFLMSRIREEAHIMKTRFAILKGLSRTGNVITSAGIVLAATFAALGVIPILFLAQLAFIVALGVLLDTLIVRSLIVPALSYELGPKIWWPNKKMTK